MKSKLNLTKRVLIIAPHSDDEICKSQYINVVIRQVENVVFLA